MSDNLHHLAAAYSLDALDPDERAAFEAHLDGCESCRADVADFRNVTGDLAAATAEPAPGDLRARVLSDISETRQDAPIRRTADPQPGRPARFVLSAAAVIIAFVVGAAVVLLADRGSNDLEDVLAAPDAVTVPLDGEVGSARVVWSAELAQGAFIADGVDDPDDGQVYELWAITDGTPVPAGLFTPDDNAIRSLVEIDGAAIDPAAWGVTIEPEGGSAQPTGEILYYGEV